MSSVPTVHPLYTDISISQVFHIPHEERKFDTSNKFGEGDLLKTCADIMQSTGATIETSYAKDQSLTFVVIGNWKLFLTRISDEFYPIASLQLFSKFC